MGNYLLVALSVAISIFHVGHCGVVKPLSRVASEQHREFTCTGGDGIYASPGECTNVYYYCMNGLAVAQMCPEGDVFDPVTFRCTTFNQASCNQKFDCTSDGIFPYPDACTNLYYLCSGGQSYIEYCPENYVFDPIMLQCKPKDSATCSSETTVTEAIPSETSTSEIESTTSEVESTTSEVESTTPEVETTMPSTTAEIESTTIEVWTTTAM